MGGHPHWPQEDPSRRTHHHRDLCDGLRVVRSRQPHHRIPRRLGGWERSLRLDRLGDGSWRLCRCPSRHHAVRGGSWGRNGLGSTRRWRSGFDFMAGPLPRHRYSHGDRSCRHRVFRPADPDRQVPAPVCHRAVQDSRRSADLDSHAGCPGLQLRLLHLACLRAVPAGRGVRSSWWSVHPARSGIGLLRLGPHGLVGVGVARTAFLRAPRYSSHSCRHPDPVHH